MFVKYRAGGGGDGVEMANRDNEWLLKGKEKIY